MGFTTKWYMADPHFGHDKIREHVAARAGFSSVEDMDMTIIGRVNERLRDDDLLFVLGDFALSSDPEYLAHCFHAMRGRKILLIGNHDTDKKGRLLPALEALSWDVPPVHAMETKDGGKRLWLSHYAHRVWPASRYGGYHFYGHSHGSLEGVGRSRDVGIDLPDMDFGPRRFEELIKGME